MTEHTHSRLNPTYVKLATTLRLYIVYPLLLALITCIAAYYGYDALWTCGLLALAITQFTMAYVLHKGIMQDNTLCTKIFDLFILAEIPHHNDGKAGLGYVFIFLILGVILSGAQLLYWLYLFFA